MGFPTAGMWAKMHIKLTDWPPGLTSQRHSALISSDSEQFRLCFSAVHYLKISEQRWFSSEQRWKRKFSELRISAETTLIFSETALIQGWTALISFETAMNSADFWRIQNDNFLFIFHCFFEICGCTSVLRHINQNLSPICEQKLSAKIKVFNLLTGQRYN